jgi:hypothetical protein
MSVIIGSARRRAGILICSLTLVLGSGCHREPTVGASPTASAGDESQEGVLLKPDEVEKMGIKTIEAKTYRHTPEAEGFGTVLAHETVAQAVADLSTALAAQRQSRAAFARAQRLAGTPGAGPVETQENAERQASVDQAALQLAQRRLSALLGQNPPWKNPLESPELTALANGDSKLVRVTFPLGALGETNPTTLRLSSINPAAGTRSIPIRSVWSAPADASVPGRSFFALLKHADVGEGEKMLAWAPVGGPETGVEVPVAAVVMSGGKWWCYVERKPGTFVRAEINPSMPTAAGYFVNDGMSAGDKIVVHPVGELLAREMNPSADAD